MAAFDRIRCMAIAVVELVIGQVEFGVDVLWHAPVLKLHAATLYKSGLGQKGEEMCIERETDMGPSHGPVGRDISRVTGKDRTSQSPSSP